MSISLSTLVSAKALNRMARAQRFAKGAQVAIRDDRNAFIREGEVVENALARPTAPALLVLFKLPGRRDCIEYDALDFEYIDVHPAS